MPSRKDCYTENTEKLGLRRNHQEDNKNSITIPAKKDLANPEDTKLRNGKYATRDSSDIVMNQRGEQGGGLQLPIRQNIWGVGDKKPAKPERE
jgi:hypothetical protein